MLMAQFYSHSVVPVSLHWLLATVVKARVSEVLWAGLLTGPRLIRTMPRVQTLVVEEGHPLVVPLALPLHCHRCCPRRCCCSAAASASRRFRCFWCCNA